MIEKQLLVKALRHYCDIIWEYEYSSDSIYVHCNKIAEAFEEKPFSVPQLIEAYKKKFGFETNPKVWKQYLNENYLRTFFEKEKSEDDFQLRFHVSGEDIKYYSIRIEKIDDNNIMITGKDLVEEIFERSLHKSLRKSFDSILNVDTDTGTYFISYSTDPEDTQIEGFDYEERLIRFIERYVVESEKEKLLEKMKLEHVKKVLAEQEEYTLFLTIYDKKGGFAYKRVMYSYFDEKKQLITVSRIDISTVVKKYEEQISKIRKENYRDALTGTFNRNYYETNLKDTVMHAGIAIIDIDDFKICNDAYGHSVGDRILVKVGRIIRKTIGQEGTAIRYGGDEFLLILPETSAEAMDKLLDEIRQKVWASQLSGYEQMHLSVSIGGVLAEDETVEKAVYRADQLMYRAKRSKNKVVTEWDCTEEDADEQSVKQKQQILIVDDSEINRMLLAQILQDEFRILEASNGDEALEMIERYGTGIAIVLLDIIMPVKDGFEVLTGMNKTHRIDEIPVIMISSDDSDANIKRAYSLGVSDYIGRPFDAKVVYRRVWNTVMLYTKQRKLISMLAQQYRESEEKKN